MLKPMLKPTLGKVIIAILITIFQFFFVIGCLGVLDGNIDGCSRSIFLILISIPIYFLAVVFLNTNLILTFLVSFVYIYFIISFLNWKLIDKYRKEDGTLNLYEACRTEVAEWRGINFPTGVAIGSVLLIILINVISISDPIIIFAPIIAGIIAGISACKSKHSDSAGFIAGALGGMVYVLLHIDNPIFRDYNLYFGLFETIIWRIPVIFEASFLYFGVLGLIGGAIGGFLYNHAPEIKTFLEPKSDYADKWYNKGVKLGGLGRHDEAIKAYKKATEIKPDDADAWYNCACIYSAKGEKEKALIDLKKAIEIDGTNKEEAKKDKDFKNLWDDKDFKKLVD